MEYNRIRVLHITNNIDIGGVQKIIYQLSLLGKEYFSYVAVASIGGVYEKKLSESNIPHFTIPNLSSKNPKDIRMTIHQLKDLIEKNDINVIHCHHRMAVLFAKLIAKNKIIIYNNHTIYSNKRQFSHSVLNNINLIADGDKAKENLTKYFKLDPTKVVTIYNAVDSFDGKLNIINEIKEAKDKGYFIVMNSARLHPQKGMKYFIEAAKILIDRGLKIRFYIVGNGPLKDYLIELVKEKRLDKSVFFLGFRNDIKNTIAQCDVLVLTSIYEGLPLTPMEAFSVKKAVIGTDIDGTREVIKHGINGLLAKTKDPLSIADSIHFMYDNRDKLKIMNKNAYEYYIKYFSLNKFREEYLDYYRKL
ncbi:glycosyltransferase [Dubosiella newyorkensis]|nr:glycosyltransferase [Dubosiella newyorkensis]